MYNAIYTIENGVRRLVSNPKPNAITSKENLQPYCEAMMNLVSSLSNLAGPGSGQPCLHLVKPWSGVEGFLSCEPLIQTEIDSSVMPNSALFSW